MGKQIEAKLNESDEVKIPKWRPERLRSAKVVVEVDQSI